MHGLGFVLVLLLGGSSPAAQPSDSVWVSDERSGTVVLVDGSSGTVVATIPVGRRPRGLRLSADGGTLFVATSGTPAVPPGTSREAVPAADPAADGIAVVDTHNRQLLRRLPGGSDPESFDLSPDGRMLYVSNEDAGTLSAVNVAAARVDWSIPVGGQPEGVAVRPDGKVVYVTCEGTDSVVAIDVVRKSVVARMSTPSRPRGVVFSADGGRAFVTAEMSGKVFAVDARRHRVMGSVALGQGALPMGLVLTPDENVLYVSTGRGGAVVAVDTGTLAVRARLRGIGPRVWGLGRAADGRLFAAAGPSGELVELAPGAASVRRRIRIGGLPWGVTVWRATDAQAANVEFQSP